MAIYRDQAHRLKLMAHPVRLHILDLLRASDECVCHLSAALSKSQPYVSQQLALLRNAGLILDHKEGTNVFYGLADEQAAAVLSALFPAGADGATRGHARVASCNCPKCTAEGLCGG